MFTVQILQCDGFWMGTGELVTFAQANEQAVSINEKYYTATRVLNSDSYVPVSVLYVLPQFAEVAYPGPSCAAARDVLARFAA